MYYKANKEQKILSKEINYTFFFCVKKMRTGLRKYRKYSVHASLILLLFLNNNFKNT